MSPAAVVNLTKEMLARFAERAGTCDQENRFFEENFQELRAARYLLLPVSGDNNETPAIEHANWPEVELTGVIFWAFSYTTVQLLSQFGVA